MKELVKHFKEQPKEAIKEVAMCLSILSYAVRCCFYLQSCRVAPFQGYNGTGQGNDSNHRYNGSETQRHVEV